jgi:hypothetical protein
LVLWVTYIAVVMWYWWKSHLMSPIFSVEVPTNITILK